MLIKCGMVEIWNDKIISDVRVIKNYVEKIKLS